MATIKPNTTVTDAQRRINLFQIENDRDNKKIKVKINTIPTEGLLRIFGMSQRPQLLT